MMHSRRQQPSLRSFLGLLEKSGNIIHVKDEVSIKFEVARILKEFDGGPAVLFERIIESASPIVGNVCGTRHRICDALNIREEKLYQTLLKGIQNPLRPKIVEKAPVKEVIEKPRLTKLPILIHYEKDAGPYITSAVVVARTHDEKIENLSIHRLLVLDDSHLAIRIVPHRHLHQIYEMEKKAGNPLEIAIAIGLHPAITLSSCLPAPLGLSEYDIANSLLNGALTITKCENVNVFVPTHAEIVLEGVITDEEISEGPFADLIGTYDIVRSQPIIEVVGVMRRKTFLYQALLPGSLENSLLMGIGRELNIWSAMKEADFSIKAINLTPGGAGWLHAIISIKKRTDKDPQKAIEKTFSAHPSLKHVVIVDEDIDVFNPREVEWAIATRFQAGKGLTVMENVRGSTLDPSGENGITSKVGIDATKPLDKPAFIFEKAKIPESSRVKDVLKKLTKEKGVS